MNNNPLIKLFETAMGDSIGEYKIEEKIGTGGSSIVFKASKGTEIKAIKVMCVENLESNSSTLGSEITIGMNICSNYLVRYYGVMLKGIFQCIIMDYFPNGDLQTYLNKGNKLNKDDIIRLTYQIVSALKILHEKNIIHRDLKLQNIFVTEDKNFKLGDYGLSRKQGVSMTMGAGTEGYQAPEVLDGHKYSTSADMYSFGVILYILMSGRHPFANEEGNFSMVKAVMGKYDRLVSDEFREELKELCYSLMKQRQEERPRPEDILKRGIFVVGVEEIIARDEKIKEMREEMETLKKENETLKKEKEEVIKEKEREKKEKEKERKEKEKEKKEKEEAIKEKEEERKEKEVALKENDELRRQLETSKKELSDLKKRSTTENEKTTASSSSSSSFSSSSFSSSSSSSSPSSFSSSSSSLKESGLVLGGIGDVNRSAVEEQIKITFIPNEENGGEVEGRKIKFTKDYHYCTIFINKILSSRL